MKKTKKIAEILNFNNPHELLKYYIEEWDFEKNEIRHGNRLHLDDDVLFLKRLNKVITFLTQDTIQWTEWSLKIDGKNNETTNFRFYHKTNHDIFEIQCIGDLSLELTPVYVNPFSYLVTVETINESIIGFREKHPLAQKNN